MPETFPKIIYGTAWKKERTRDLAQLAFETGFRAVDTANQPKHYDESLLGSALKIIFEKGEARENFFIQTKFTPLDGHDARVPYHPDVDIPTQVEQSFESSLKHLNVNYLDSYLLHGPYNHPGLGEEDMQVWQALEKIHGSGRAKRIGVSNVNALQLSEFLRSTLVKPMVVQNRCFANRGWDEEVRAVCRTHGIIYEGFSLLTANPQVVNSPQVFAIAKRLNKTPAQIVFAFAIQIGILPLTGTTNQGHMRDDLGAVELSLPEEYIHTIGSIQ